jgi:hypothetical protein
MTQNVKTPFQRAFPFSFTLLDDRGKPAIYIVSEDDIDKQYLTLEVTNTSGGPLHFPSLPMKEPLTKDNCHFILRFRRSAIAPLSPEGKPEITLGQTGIQRSSTDQKKPDNGGVWRIKISSEEKSPWVDLYLGRTAKAPWSLMPAEKIRIKLNSITAPRGLGSRTSRVELILGAFFSTGQEAAGTISESPANGQNGGAPTSASLRKFSREQILEVINHQGSPNIPLHAGIIGPNTLRNDGTAMSDFRMTLRLTNTSAKKTITFDELSKVQFHFFSDQKEDDKTEGAIGHADEVRKITFTLGAITQFFDSSSQEGEEPFWTFDFDQLYAGHPQLQLGPKEFLEFKINFAHDAEGFMTTHPQGITLLHILYENIPDFWDGELRCPLELRPLAVQTAVENGVKKVSIDSGQRVMDIKAPELNVYLTKEEQGKKTENLRLQLQEPGRMTLTGEENQLTLNAAGDEPGLSAGKDLHLSAGENSQVILGPNIVSASKEGLTLQFDNREKVWENAHDVVWNMVRFSIKSDGDDWRASPPRLEIKTLERQLSKNIGNYYVWDFRPQLAIDNRGLALKDGKALTFEGDAGSIKAGKKLEFVVGGEGSEEKMTLNKDGVLKVKELKIGDTVLNEQDLKKLLNPETRRKVLIKSLIDGKTPYLGAQDLPLQTGKTVVEYKPIIYQLPVDDELQVSGNDHFRFELIFI